MKSEAHALQSCRQRMAPLTVQGHLFPSPVVGRSSWPPPHAAGSQLTCSLALHFMVSVAAHFQAAMLLPDSGQPPLCLLQGSSRRRQGVPTTPNSQQSLLGLRVKSSS